MFIFWLLVYFNLSLGMAQEPTVPTHPEVVFSQADWRLLRLVAPLRCNGKPPCFIAMDDGGKKRVLVWIPPIEELPVSLEVEIPNTEDSAFLAAARELRCKLKFDQDFGLSFPPYGNDERRCIFLLRSDGVETRIYMYVQNPSNSLDDEMIVWRWEGLPSPEKPLVRRDDLAESFRMGLRLREGEVH